MGHDPDHRARGADWAVTESGQVVVQNGGGWQSLAEKSDGQIIDLKEWKSPAPRPLAGSARRQRVQEIPGRGATLFETCVFRIAAKGRRAPAQPRAIGIMKFHVFESEDAAADFIVNVKRIDSEDDFTYVILPDPMGSGKFIIEIVTPKWGSLGRI